MRRIIVVSGFVILMLALSPDMLSCRDYVSVWREEEALCVERLGPSSPPYVPSTDYQCDKCLSSQGRWGSWLGCQFLPAVTAVFILELAVNIGRSRMCQASNL